MSSRSKATFMRAAREHLDIDHTAFLQVVRSGLVDCSDLWGE